MDEEKFVIPQEWGEEGRVGEPYALISHFGRGIESEKKVTGNE